jgi:hypothetical protein
MRTLAVCDSLVSSAIRRLLKCVLFSGIDSIVLVTTSPSASVSDRGVPGRGSWKEEKLHTKLLLKNIGAAQLTQRGKDADSSKVTMAGDSSEPALSWTSDSAIGRSSTAPGDRKCEVVRGLSASTFLKT